MRRIRRALADPGLAATYLYRGAKRWVGARYHGGQWRSVPEHAVWDGEWDLAVVLDACRPDVLAECAPDVAFLPEEIPSRRSNASQSATWMARNFDEEYADEMAETTYVTANPYSEAADTGPFDRVDEVWRYAWSEDLGTQPAEPVTDRAVALGRETDSPRTLVHYMQPHYPSVPADLGSGMDIDRFGEAEGATDVFPRLRRGDVTFEAAWDAYRRNCEYVLEQVAVLLENVDADRVVITADHGNAFGEWGYFRHPQGCPVPAVREVPWVETTATDRGTHDPAEYDTTRVDADVAEQLRELGYA